MYAVAIEISSMLYNTADVSITAWHITKDVGSEVCSEENTLCLKGDESMIMFAHM